MHHALDSTCKALVENLPDGVCYASTEGTIVYANRSFSTLLGFSAHQVLSGLSFLRFIHPDYRVLMEDFLYRILQKDHSLSTIQVQIMGSDAHERWMEIRWIDIPVEEGAFLVIHDLTSYKTLQEELLLQALTDELTGLYNRRGFRMMAEQELKHCQRLKTEVVLLSIDIDTFKQINDTFGHDEGDRVLKSVAKTLQTSFRSSDIIGRWGGDEFLVLALDAPSGTVEMLTARFRQTLSDISQRQGLPCMIAVTIGSASSSKKAIPSLELLIQQADRAMYANKRR
ncbi:sensor domain-containing diguanylate cyclase [Sphaerochaeta globosa]|uniref:Diguanylate cyclase with PAS/PAC sensor n=1 Tax=Sphaerochaeta globosa (strain ATCC BAA-1886 / DSM 22777 / Buddy) TaxID=158189 RepID=F0RZT9_SPHGB|nr:sensor domain-containing diguanylate cyclase [Sphaerochaeta globosa]ADY14840.1 diguanylate cyclase with PAS/PAC sensor [Sphaerochaeta globosa str. Buddy]